MVVFAIRQSLELCMEGLKWSFLITVNIKRTWYFAVDFRGVAEFVGRETAETRSFRLINLHF